MRPLWRTKTRLRCIPQLMVVNMENMGLDPTELERYARHLALPDWGVAGQKKIKNAAVLIVGLGGLGSIASLYLAAAGVGRMGLVDEDWVSLSNLQRQILYTTQDIDLPKAALAEKRLREFNPKIQVQAYPLRLTKENAVELIEGYDVVIDGTDNFATRLILNEICCKLDKPYIFGAVNGFDGQVSVFHASRGPCLGCLFPKLDELGCETVGEHLAVLNTVPAIIGVLQATQALKLILGMGEGLIGHLLIFNALELSFNTFEIPKRTQCKICG